MVSTSHHGVTFGQKCLVSYVVGSSMHFCRVPLHSGSTVAGFLVLCESELAFRDRFSELTQMNLVSDVWVGSSQRSWIKQSYRELGDRRS